MNRLTLLAGLVALGLGGAATAQMTTQESHVMPNGNVRTTTTHVGPMGGVHETTRVDRTDGSTRIVQRDNGWRGDRDDMQAHDRGWHDRGRHHGWRNREVCRVTWHHGHRMRRCWNR